MEQGRRNGGGLANVYAGTPFIQLEDMGERYKLCPRSKPFSTYEFVLKYEHIWVNGSCTALTIKQCKDTHIVGCSIPLVYKLLDPTSK